MPADLKIVPNPNPTPPYAQTTPADAQRAAARAFLELATLAFQILGEDEFARVAREAIGCGVERALDDGQIVPRLAELDAAILEIVARALNEVAAAAWRAGARQ